jgi:aminoglycoside phosphotransferase (APT) family kinase protein
MQPSLDHATAVRPGEELPVATLAAYLDDHLPELRGPVVVEQFPHGHSNLTYLVRLGGAELVLRRPPFGNVVKSAHDVGREYKVLAKLCQAYPLAPRPYLYCADESVIGAPFYLMERRHGFIMRQKPAAGVPSDPSTMKGMSEALIDSLAQLHGLDYVAIGLGDLGKPDGYVQRQVSGWIKRFEQAKTGEAPVLDQVATWLSGHLPETSRAALIHNDFKFDNLVLDPANPTRVVAVLDWEMATVGDPLMDLGTTLGYWVEAGDPAPLQAVATGPTALPGCLTRRELAERYGEVTGRPVDNLLFYYGFGLFKIAVIVQQIYARYVRGHTTDQRFAHLDGFVGALGEQADRCLATGRV